MLRSLIDLEGYAIRATDGLIGHVKDIYFDDEGLDRPLPSRRDGQLAGES